MNNSNAHVPGTNNQENGTLESGPDASYTINSMLIKLPFVNQLFNDQNNENKEIKLRDTINSKDWSVFIHECAHLLQNTATISGLYEFVIHLRLLSAFAGTLNNAFQSVGSDAKDDYSKSIIENLLKYINCIRGDKSPTDHTYQVHVGKKTLEVLRIEKDIHQLALPEHHEIEEVVVTLKVSSDRSAPTEHRFKFGTTCLNEGLGWELEKKSLSVDGVSDEQIRAEAPPTFPYEVFRAVYEYYMGAQTIPDNMIRAGLIALQSESPVITFLEICSVLQEREHKENQDFPQDLIDKMQQTFDANIDHLFRQTVNPIFRRFSSLKPIKAALVLIYCNYRKFLQLRKLNPFLEFSLVGTDRPLKWLLDLITGMPRFLILQNSDPSAGGNEVSITWLDVNDSEPTELQNTELESLVIFTAMNSFLFAHSSTTKLASTQLLINNIDKPRVKARVSCHLFGACSNQQAITTPNICINNPWDSSKSPENACPYGAAVAILVKGAGLEVNLS